MAKSIATGKPQRAERRKPKAENKEHTASLLSAYCRLPTAFRGFTLLELMIVITIVIILAAIALPQYQKSILAAREAVLREDLYNFRKLLDQFAADKGKLPQSLDELVSEHYMREMPVDPITGQADWTVVSGEDPNSTSGEQGVTDVKSSSGDTSSDGTPYSEW